MGKFIFSMINMWDGILLLIPLYVMYVRKLISKLRNNILYFTDISVSVSLCVSEWLFSVLAGYTV